MKIVRLAILFITYSVIASEGLVFDQYLDVFHDGENLLNENDYLNAYLHEFDQQLYTVRAVSQLGQFYINSCQPDCYDVIKTDLYRGKSWDGHLHMFFKKYVKPGTVVVDAGAHIGSQTLLLAQLVGAEGTVWAFEPQLSMYRELVMNVKLNSHKNVKIRRNALANEHAIGTMRPAVPRNQGGTPLGEGGDKVELRTLDSFNLINVSLMKIDVEGSEDNLLEGARQTITQNRPVILIEIQGGHVFQTAPQQIKEKILHTKSILESMGYQVRQIRAHDYLALPG